MMSKVTLKKPTLDTVKMQLLPLVRNIYAEWMRRRFMLESGVEFTRYFKRLSQNMTSICIWCDAWGIENPLPLQELMRNAQKAKTKEEYLKAINDGDVAFRKAVETLCGKEAMEKCFTLAEMEIKPKLGEEIQLKIRTVAKPGIVEKIPVVAPITKIVSEPEIEEE
jgi:hypothetical protein